MASDKRILVLIRIVILPLCLVFQIQNCAISGMYLNIFLYIKKEGKTVEWNQMTFNGVL